MNDSGDRQIERAIDTRKVFFSGWNTFLGLADYLMKSEKDAPERFRK